jgi:hypothetical protein
MSSDFEAALKAGSDIVRVGTGIFDEEAITPTTKAVGVFLAWRGAGWWRRCSNLFDMGYDLPGLAY